MKLEWMNVTALLFVVQAEAAQAVGLAPIVTGRSTSPEPRRSGGIGAAGSLPLLPPLPARSNLSGGSGDDWWRT
jgi:hypothetical protein